MPARHKIESFIPLWEWDLPKKKKRRLREDGSEKKKGKEKAISGADDSRGTSPTAQPHNGEGGAHIEEVETSGDSRPVSRGARVEDAPEDDE